ncbi:bile acid-CoA:amino acid N-acyltransferase-like isoform X2 [Megalops cyprinoides]|uniref:bile acid-CoA:amino acid N-acyltransferase-like isoform X2 n=1 Tax=Megalops cyprinoides TaxID=118141 RepID=UPI001864FF5A|nr:bile acid-CoA:amino acid N-acyltransferase-like isoform X2 [Megalops cyprinoides]
MQGSFLCHSHWGALRQLLGLSVVRARLNKKTVWLHCMMGTMRQRSSCSPAPLLMAMPTRALMDEPIMLEARHLPPHCPITIRARMRSEDGDLWEALAHYHADGRGVVNLSRDEAQGGSYTGREPMGLFWSLLPAPGEREGLRLRKRNVETPFTVRVSLLRGHVLPPTALGCSRDARGRDTQVQEEELAAVTLERWYMAPGVRRVAIREGGVVGTLFLPPGPGPFPVVLDLWGMGGGLVEYRSALLASQGFASLALAYFGHRDIPGPLHRINVGDAYFLPRCVIGINGPMGSMNKLVDFGGKGESFQEDQKHWSYDEEGYVSFRGVSLPANIPPDHMVKIEDLRCPLLLIVGEDDLSCAAMENADKIEEGLQAAGKSHLITRLSYPGAGHLIEPPYSPNARSSLWSTRPTKLITLWGGHLGPHAYAQEHSWKKILEFLDRHLRGGS